MQAVKIKIGGHYFLLPDGFDFAFPDYVNEHLKMIRQYIVAGEETLAAMQNYGSVDTTEIQKRTKILKSELAEFKARTGIIGFPFDSRDVDLYIAANNINVVSSVDFD